jgi:hypothetical protein
MLGGKSAGGGARSGDGDVVLPVEMRLFIYAGGADGGVWGAFGRCADREGRGERVRWRKASAAHGGGGGGGGGGGVCDVEAEWRGCERKQSRNAVEMSEVSAL